MNDPSRYPVPPGPTPHELAKSAPAVMFSRFMYRAYVLTNSLRDRGGARTLARNWSPAGRQRFARALNQLRGAVEEAAADIESVDRSIGN